jgi:phosphate transport system substrate-binding protein
MLQRLTAVARRAAAVVVVIGAAGAALGMGPEVRLQGAGATFPNPLYQRWVSEYQKSHPDVKIDYQSIGSGGGIKGITEKTVDFAGSDAPMNKKELEAAGGEANIVEVPSCAGAVVPAYNVPGVSELKFTGEALAGIFMGTISKWNDAQIAASNPGVKLPGLAIMPAWRTDGSGTTYVFTNYLTTQSEPFKTTVGAGKQVKWPAGQGGKGNEGVSAAVQQTAGAIGYIEQNYADANHIAYGSVKNKAGKFVKASADTVSAAGQGAAGDLKGTILAANIWNQPGDNAYPIASFTYLIVYKDLNNLKSKAQAEALGDFLWWAAHDGQKLATELDYAPLAQGVQQKVEEALRTLTFSGKTLAFTASGGGK